MNRRFVIGLGTGALVGALDVALIALVDGEAGGWLVLQSFLAWTACGASVVAAETGLRPLVQGVALTIALNLAWFVALGPAIGKPEHVAPLVAMSLVFGLVFGLARIRALRTERRRA